MPNRHLSLRRKNDNISLIFLLNLPKRWGGSGYKQPKKAWTAQNSLKIENVNYDHKKKEIQIKVSNSKGLDF
jgi:hypothetical protein